jgi:hypothetical protein
MLPFRNRLHGDVDQSRAKVARRLTKETNKPDVAHQLLCFRKQRSKHNRRAVRDDSVAFV